MHSLAFVQLDPASDNSKVSFICTYKLELIAKRWEALGMSIQGFYAQKEEKKRGKGKVGGEMGKTNISEELEQIKGILFSKTTESPGITISLQNPEKTLQTGHRFHLLKKRGEQLGLRNSHSVSAKMEGPPCNRRPSPCRLGGLTGPQCPPSAPRHVFLWIAQKSASAVTRHKLFDNNMTQLIKTRPQNVCAWGPANFAMCLRG